MIMSSFSVIKNGRDLIKFDKNNKLNLFNGLKVWTMVLVLFGHKFLYTVTSPILNGNRYEMVNTILRKTRHNHLFSTRSYMFGVLKKQLSIISLNLYSIKLTVKIN